MSTFAAHEYEAFEGPDPEFESQEWENHEHAEAFEVFELGEATEMELAQELLEVASEQELEEFLGKLVRKVARGASALVRSPIGKALGGVLRNVAKTALPVVGSALGSMVAPGIGTAIGGRLGSMASSLLEVQEMESMTEAEAEFEAARRYVRWASGTIRSAARAPRGVPPRIVVRSAAVASARRYAPTLLGAQAFGSQRTSPWRRRRGPAWGVPGPVAQPAWGAPQCTCGAAQSWAEPPFGPTPGNDGPASGWGGGPDEDLDTFGYESGESLEANESHEAAAGAGRWVRRGNRIVLLGA